VNSFRDMSRRGMLLPIKLCSAALSVRCALRLYLEAASAGKNRRRKIFVPEGSKHAVGDLQGRRR